MDRDSFWQEIVNLVKHHKRRSYPVEPLPEEKMEQLETNVYTHIDQLFSSSEVTSATAQSDITTAGPQHKSSYKQENSLIARLFQHRHAPVFAMAMFALFSVGVLAFLLSNNRISEPLFDMPESIVAADMDRYIQIPQENLRALAKTVPSERRSAFLAGVAQADLDLIGDIENPAAHQIALWYHQTTTNTTVVDAVNALKTVESSVARYAANEQSGLWLKHGYAVEVVHLAAKRSLVDLNTGVLVDALRFYSDQALTPVPSKTDPENPELKSSSVDVVRQYIHNHEKLLIAIPTNSPTPGQVQEIIDMTHSMKVLIQ